jgi:hypothetical protein
MSSPDIYTVSTLDQDAVRLAYEYAVAHGQTVKVLTPCCKLGHIPVESADWLCGFAVGCRLAHIEKITLLLSKTRKGAKT